MAEVNEIVLEKLTALKQRCANFTAAVERAQAGKESSTSKFSTWKSAITPNEMVEIDLVNYLEDNAEATNEDLVGLLILIDKIRDDISNHLQSNFFRTLPAPTAQVSDLSAERKAIAKEYGLLCDMAEMGWFEESLLAEYLPIKIGRIGQMKADGPLLNLPKAPAEGPVVRSNSQLRLVCDGQVVEGHNLSAAIANALGLTFGDIKKLTDSDFSLGKDWEINGHTISFIRSV